MDSVFPSSLVLVLCLVARHNIFRSMKHSCWPSGRQALSFLGRHRPQGTEPCPPGICNPREHAGPTVTYDVEGMPLGPHCQVAGEQEEEKGEAEACRGRDTGLGQG